MRINSSPEILSDMNNLPIKTVNGATVYLKDVATVRDGFAVQTNIVRTNGTRGALLTILRNGQASTLDIVNKVKAQLPRIEAAMPPELKVRQLFDQSLFVRASINGVVREALIAALLTGLMILLFLGSWRSTVIVCISIPLSILTSLIILNLMGQTINVMTLGGLALAVGILVDDATVEIENTHRNLAMKKPLVRAVLDGAQQIAIPAFVSTLSICIVFVPVLLLTGAAKYLFTPLALAVVFAMLASYMLSRTLIPTMVHYLLKPEVDMYRSGEHGEGRNRRGPSVDLAHPFRFQSPVRAFSRCLHRIAGLGAGSSAAPFSPYSWFFLWAPWVWSTWWEAIFSPPWIPGRSVCTRRRRPARASKRRRCYSPKSRRRFAASFRSGSWIRFSTISAFPRAASIWPSETARPSGATTATF